MTFTSLNTTAAAIAVAAPQTTCSVSMISQAHAGPPFATGDKPMSPCA